MSSLREHAQQDQEAYFNHEKEVFKTLYISCHLYRGKRLRHLQTTNERRAGPCNLQ